MLGRVLVGVNAGTPTTADGMHRPLVAYTRVHRHLLHVYSITMLLDHDEFAGLVRNFEFIDISVLQFYIYKDIRPPD